MSSPVRSIAIDASATDADRVMRQHDISCLAVLDRDQRPVGVITRTDLLQAARAATRLHGPPAVLELPSLAVGDLMTAGPVALDGGAPICDAARELTERHIHRIFVSDGDDLVGVVGTKEILRAVLDARLGAPLSQWMSHPVVAVDARDSIATATELLGKSSLSSLVVLEGALPVGLFTQREVLESRGLAATTAVEEVMSQAMLALPKETPLFRAAGFTISTRARRVLAVDHHHVTGVVSGLDFARAVAASGPEPIAATGNS
ncbi:MAG: CBS domain-containing protein [Polyangia bacterium]